MKAMPLRRLILLCASSLAAAMAAVSAYSQPSVLQRGYDSNVSGSNLSETTLTTANVGPGTFGLLFTLPVDYQIYTQPLYVPNLAIPGQGTHNVVFVATMYDSVYAFDADTAGPPLWSINLATLVGATPVPIANFAIPPNSGWTGKLGVLSTPVIDPTTKVMYVVAGTLENGAMAYRLHGINILNGTEPYGPGVLISASQGTVAFDANFVVQRMSLALANGQVIIGFSALEHEVAGNYAGWVLAYNETTLKQSAAFATTTVGSLGGGVWQSGSPPAVDGSHNVYLFVGNGYNGNGYDGVNNFAESALKLSTASGLSLVDWFTPTNWAHLDEYDLDLTSAGPLLIPGTSMLFGGGKSSTVYLMNTQNMGKFNSKVNQVLQVFSVGHGLRGTPAWWNRASANGGPLVYTWGVLGAVTAYSFNGTKFTTTPQSQGTGEQIFPGGILAVSANGSEAGTGILWATSEINNDAPNGELHAFNAADVSTELYNTTMNASRDNLGYFAKFAPPTVVNGKVYVPTFSKKLAVYGLL
jgi:hypothetical protein